MLEEFLLLGALNNYWTAIASLIQVRLMLKICKLCVNMISLGNQTFVMHNCTATLVANCCKKFKELLFFQTLNFKVCDFSKSTLRKTNISHWAMCDNLPLFYQLIHHSARKIPVPPNLLLTIVTHQLLYLTMSRRL